jgi:hypothetical protein
MLSPYTSVTSPISRIMASGARKRCSTRRRSLRERLPWDSILPEPTFREGGRHPGRDVHHIHRYLGSQTLIRVPKDNLAHNGSKAGSEGLIALPCRIRPNHRFMARNAGMTILVGERAPFRIRILTTLLYPMSLPAHGFWLKLGPAQTRRSVVGRSQLRARSGRWRQIGGGRKVVLAVVSRGDLPFADLEVLDASLLNARC